MKDTITTEKYILNIEIIQDAVEDLTEALAKFASVAKRMESPTYYGRDARNILVEDGTSFRSDRTDCEMAYQKAQEAVQNAIDLGILKQIPYDLQSAYLFD